MNQDESVVPRSRPDETWKQVKMVKIEISLCPDAEDIGVLQVIWEKVNTNSGNNVDISGSK